MTNADKEYLDGVATELVGMSSLTIRQALDVAYRMGRVDAMLEGLEKTGTISDRSGILGNPREISEVAQ